MIPVISVARKTAKKSLILLGLATAMIPLLIPRGSLIPSLIPAKNRLLMPIMESLETLESEMSTFRKPQMMLRCIPGTVSARSVCRYETRTPPTHTPRVGTDHKPPTGGLPSAQEGNPMHSWTPHALWRGAPFGPELIPRDFIDLKHPPD